MKPENMTPAELVRFLAGEGMGYRSHGGICHTEDGSEFWFVQISDSGPVPWNPLTDANDLLMLVEAMQKKDWQLILNVGFESEPILATFINHRVNSNPDQFATIDHDIKTAVCIAAAKALMQMKETPYE